MESTDSAPPTPLAMPLAGHSTPGLFTVSSLPRFGPTSAERQSGYAGLGCLQKEIPSLISFVTFPRKKTRNSSLFSVCKNYEGVCRPTPEILQSTNYCWTSEVVRPGIVGGVFPSELPPVPAHHPLHLQKSQVKHRGRVASDGCSNAPEHRDR